MRSRECLTLLAGLPFLYCLSPKARYQFTDCYATVQMFNYYAQVRRKWKLLYHVVSDELFQTFHNKVGG